MNKTIGRLLNAATQQIGDGGSVLFNDNTFSNCAIGYDGKGGIQLRSPGTYLILANFTVLATAAQTVAVQMYEGSSAISGAISEATLAASEDYASLGINWIVTVKPSCPPMEYATISFNLPTASSLASANVIVEKL